MKIVSIVDLDETLGVFKRNVFYVRPKVNVLINLLRLLNIDIILLSLGDDNYVKDIVNVFLPDIKKNAYKIFARKECKRSYKRYGVFKAAEHIRKMYDESIFLIGIDDKASENMNSNYDIRIYVSPYKIPNPGDKTLLKPIEHIIQTLITLTPQPCLNLNNIEEFENDCFLCT